MWRFGAVIAAISITLSPMVASATVYNFHDTEMSALSPSPVTFTFSLDTATAISSASGTIFSNVSINENGTIIPGNTIGASYTTYLASPLFFLIDTGLEPFYSGAGTGITFNLATFPIADGATDGEGTLTISSSTTSPVPEPATWTLVLAGCAIAAVVRRFSLPISSSNRIAA